MRGNTSGYALLGMLVVLSLLAAGYVARALNIASTQSENRAQRESLRSLHDARLALLAYSLIEDNVPGTLPCPSNTLDGKGTPGCGNTDTLAFGRLPWHQLGMMHGTDGAGECLWYGVSGPFKNVGNTSQRNASNAINPARPGQIDLSDGTTHTLHAAIVLAPGRALNTQIGQRVRLGDPCASGLPAAFLEAENGRSNADGDANYALHPETSAFNDLALGIPADSLIRPLIRRVLTTLSAPPIRGEIGARLAAAPGSANLAQIRLMNAPGFDMLLDPLAQTGSAGDCPGNNAVLRKPVAWLCFNDWYSHIQVVNSGPQWSLILRAGNLPTSYRCRLDGVSGQVGCMQGI